MMIKKSLFVIAVVASLAGLVAPTPLTNVTLTSAFQRSLCAPTNGVPVARWASFAAAPFVPSSCVASLRLLPAPTSTAVEPCACRAQALALVPAANATNSASVLIPSDRSYCDVYTCALSNLALVNASNGASWSLWALSSDLRASVASPATPPQCDSVANAQRCGPHGTLTVTSGSATGSRVCVCVCATGYIGPSCRRRATATDFVGLLIEVPVGTNIGAATFTNATAVPATITDLFSRTSAQVLGTASQLQFRVTATVPRDATIDYAYRVDVAPESLGTLSSSRLSSLYLTMGTPSAAPNVAQTFVTLLSLLYGGNSTVVSTVTISPLQDSTSVALFAAALQQTNSANTSVTIAPLNNQYDPSAIAVMVLGIASAVAFFSVFWFYVLKQRTKNPRLWIICIAGLTLAILVVIVAFASAKTTSTEPSTVSRLSAAAGVTTLPSTTSHEAVLMEYASPLCSNTSAAFRVGRVIADGTCYAVRSIGQRESTLYAKALCTATDASTRYDGSSFRVAVATSLAQCVSAPYAKVAPLACFSEAAWLYRTNVARSDIELNFVSATCATRGAADDFFTTLLSTPGLLPRITATSAGSTTQPVRAGAFDPDNTAVRSQFITPNGASAEAILATFNSPIGEHQYMSTLIPFAPSDTLPTAYANVTPILPSIPLSDAARNRSIGPLGLSYGTSSVALTRTSSSLQVFSVIGGPLDLPSTPSIDGNGIMFWMKGAATSRGFIMAITDSQHDEEDESAALAALLRAEDDLQNRLSPDLGTESNAADNYNGAILYLGLYLDDTNKTLSVVVTTTSDPTAAPRVASFEASVASVLFDGNWHYVSIAQRTDSASLNFEITIDDDERPSSVSHYQCTPRNEFITPMRGSASAVPQSSPSNDLDPFSAWREAGGTLFIGAARDTSIYAVQTFRGRPTAERATTLSGLIDAPPSTVADAARHRRWMNILGSTILGAIFVSVFLVCLIATVVFTAYDLYRAKQDARTFRRSRVALTAESDAEIEADDADDNAPALRAKAIRVFAALIIVFTLVVQNTLLYFTGWDWPVEFRGPFSYFFFIFALDFTVPFPGLLHAITAIVQFAILLTSLVALYVLARQDKEQFKGRVIAPLLDLRFEQHVRGVENIKLPTDGRGGLRRRLRTAGEDKYVDKGSAREAYEGESTDAEIEAAAAADDEELRRRSYTHGIDVPCAPYIDAFFAEEVRPLVSSSRVPLNNSTDPFAPTFNPDHPVEAAAPVATDEAAAADDEGEDVQYTAPRVRSALSVLVTEFKSGLPGAAETGARAKKDEAEDSVEKPKPPRPVRGLYAQQKVRLEMLRLLAIRNDELDRNRSSSITRWRSNADARHRMMGVRSVRRSSTPAPMNDRSPSVMQRSSSQQQFSRPVSFRGSPRAREIPDEEVIFVEDQLGDPFFDHVFTAVEVEEARQRRTLKARQAEAKLKALSTAAGGGAPRKRKKGAMNESAEPQSPSQVLDARQLLELRRLREMALATRLASAKAGSPSALTSSPGARTGRTPSSTMASPRTSKAAQPTSPKKPSFTPTAGAPPGRTPRTQGTPTVGFEADLPDMDALEVRDIDLGDPVTLAVWVPCDEAELAAREVLRAKQVQASLVIHKRESKRKGADGEDVVATPRDTALNIDEATARRIDQRTMEMLDAGELDDSMDEDDRPTRSRRNKKTGRRSNSGRSSPRNAGPPSPRTPSRGGSTHGDDDGEDIAPPEELHYGLAPHVAQAFAFAVEQSAAAFFADQLARGDLDVQSPGVEAADPAAESMLLPGSALFAGSQRPLSRSTSAAGIATNGVVPHRTSSKSKPLRAPAATSKKADFDNDSGDDDPNASPLIEAVGPTTRRFLGARPPPESESSRGGSAASGSMSQQVWRRVVGSQSHGPARPDLYGAIDAEVVAKRRWEAAQRAYYAESCRGVLELAVELLDMRFTAYEQAAYELCTKRRLDAVRCIDLPAVALELNHVLTFLKAQQRTLAAIPAAVRSVAQRASQSTTRKANKLFDAHVAELLREAAEPITDSAVAAPGPDFAALRATLKFIQEKHQGLVPSACVPPAVAPTFVQPRVQPRPGAVLLDNAMQESLRRRHEDAQRLTSLRWERVAGTWRTHLVHALSDHRDTESAFAPTTADTEACVLPVTHRLASVLFPLINRCGLELNVNRTSDLIVLQCAMGMEAPPRQHHVVNEPIGDEVIDSLPHEDDTALQIACLLDVLEFSAVTFEQQVIASPPEPSSNNVASLLRSITGTATENDKAALAYLIHDRGVSPFGLLNDVDVKRVNRHVRTSIEQHIALRARHARRLIDRLSEEAVQAIATCQLVRARLHVHRDIEHGSWAATLLQLPSPTADNTNLRAFITDRLDHALTRHRVSDAERLRAIQRDQEYAAMTSRAAAVLGPHTEPHDPMRLLAASTSINGHQHHGTTGPHGVPLQLIARMRSEPAPVLPQGRRGDGSRPFVEAPPPLEKPIGHAPLLVEAHRHICPDHGARLIPHLAQYHTRKPGTDVPLHAAPHQYGRHRCALSFNALFHAMCLSDEDSLRILDAKSKKQDSSKSDEEEEAYFVCPVDGCDYAIDHDVSEPTFEHRVLSRGGQFVYWLSQKGALSYIGLAFLLGVQFLFLPGVRTAFTYVTCHITTVCDYRSCYSNADPSFVLLTYFSGLVLLLTTLALTPFFFELAFQRKESLLFSGLFAERDFDKNSAEIERHEALVAAAKQRQQLVDGSVQVHQIARSVVHVYEPQSNFGGDDYSFIGQSDTHRFPTTVAQIAFAHVPAAAWHRVVLAADDSMFKGVYHPFRARYACTEPILFVWKLLIVLMVLFVGDRGSLTQLATVSSIESVLLIAVVFTRPFVDPLVNFIASLGCAHQVGILAFDAFYRVASYDVDPYFTGSGALPSVPGGLMMAATPTFMFLLLVVFIVCVVVPLIRAALLDRRADKQSKAIAEDGSPGTALAPAAVERPQLVGANLLIASSALRVAMGGVTGAANAISMPDSGASSPTFPYPDPAFPITTTATSQGMTNLNVEEDDDEIAPPTVLETPAPRQLKGRTFGATLTPPPQKRSVVDDAVLPPPQAAVAVDPVPTAKRTPPPESVHRAPLVPPEDTATGNAKTRKRSKTPVRAVEEAEPTADSSAGPAAAVKAKQADENDDTAATLVKESSGTKVKKSPRRVNRAANEDAAPTTAEAPQAAEPVEQQPKTPRRKKSSSTLRPVASTTVEAPADTQAEEAPLRRQRSLRTPRQPTETAEATDAAAAVPARRQRSATPKKPAVDNEESSAVVEPAARKRSATPRRAASQPRPEAPAPATVEGSQTVAPLDVGADEAALAPVASMDASTPKSGKKPKTPRGSKKAKPASAVVDAPSDNQPPSTVSTVVDESGAVDAEAPPPLDVSASADFRMDDGSPSAATSSPTSKKKKTPKRK